MTEISIDLFALLSFAFMTGTALGVSIGAACVVAIRRAVRAAFREYDFR